MNCLLFKKEKVVNTYEVSEWYRTLLPSTPRYVVAFVLIVENYKLVLA
jgi:hypothetical protein